MRLLWKRVQNTVRLWYNATRLLYQEDAPFVVGWYGTIIFEIGLFAFLIWRFLICSTC